MQQGIPTEEAVLEYFSTLSNWGRWGVEDQLGTLNFLDVIQMLAEDKEALARVNAALAEEGLRYEGRVVVKHFLWVLHEDIGEETLRRMVKRPLTGLDIGAFYGCHITRPPGHYGFFDSRNNQALEKLNATSSARLTS